MPDLTLEDATNTLSDTIAGAAATLDSAVRALTPGHAPCLVLLPGYTGPDVAVNPAFVVRIEESDTPGCSTVVGADGLRQRVSLSVAEAVTRINRRGILAT